MKETKREDRRERIDGTGEAPPLSSTTSSPIEIKWCRICGSENLIPILNLGRQALTGVFPKMGGRYEVGGRRHDPNYGEAQPHTSALIPHTCPRGPVELVLCEGCGLVQLRHNYDLSLLYGDNYGYRSGLNASMVAHLRNKVAMLTRLRPLASGDTVVDIGSNDGTLLRAYEPEVQSSKFKVQSSIPNRIGFDPVGGKFREFYPEGVTLVEDFFGSVGGKGSGGLGLGSGEAGSQVSAAPYPIPHPPDPIQAAIITSISMFYDLPDPRAFVREVARCLAPDGIWHFEQSYLPAMLRTGSYDTVVVEHLEYYTLGVVKALLAQAGLRIMDVQTNNVNGGSFAVTACHHAAPFRSNTTLIEWMLRDEESMGLRTARPYREFEDRARAHRDGLVALVRSLRASGQRIIGCGASTKGNCLLQFCGFTPEDIEVIADVNPDKHGSFTPGTHIPIVSEAEARELRPDFMLVPVWHFRPGIVEREREFLERGGKLIFPFPHVEIV